MKIEHEIAINQDEKRITTENTPQMYCRKSKNMVS